MAYRDAEHCREYKARRRAQGLCPHCGEAYEASAKYSRCKNCWSAEKRRDDQKMSGDTQDLTQYAAFARGERNGLRYFSGFLPKPSWSKHTRTALTAKPGFRPLTRAAKLYQEFLIQSVMVNDLRGWIREGTEYIVEVISLVHKSDCDQWSGGIMDGLVKSTAIADDKFCEALVGRRLLVPKTEEQRVFIAVHETEKVQD